MKYRERLLSKLEGAFRIVKKQLVAAHEYQKKYYDRKTKYRHFEVGEKVYLQNTACKIGVIPKLTKVHCKGPYRIMEKKSVLNYRIRQSDLQINPLKLALDWIYSTEGLQKEERERSEITRENEIK